jgi:hypothetical protein
MMDRLPNGFDPRSDWPPDSYMDYQAPFGDPLAVDPFADRMNPWGSRSDVEGYRNAMDRQEVLERQMRESGQALRPPLPGVRDLRIPEGHSVVHDGIVIERAYRRQNRSYMLTGFATMLREDYPDCAPLPPAAADNDDDGDSLRSRGKDWRVLKQYELGFVYPDDTTIHAGLPLEGALSPRDALFCQEFLELMARHGYPGSETFLPPNLVVTPEKATAVTRGLLRMLEPTEFYAEDFFTPLERHVPAGKTVPHNRFYQALISNFVAAQAVRQSSAASSPAMHAYPLQVMKDGLSKEAIMVYVCEDGKLRAKVGGMLFPMPPQADIGQLHHYRGWSKGQMVGSEVTHYLVDDATGERTPYRTYRFNLPLAARGPKQQLVDIAGKALAGFART